MLARGFPEVKADDVALLREQVVLDVEAVHGLEVALQDGGGDQLGDFGNVVVAGFELVQRVEPVLLVRLAFLVPLRGARIDVPTEVVEARLARKFANFFFRLFLYVNKTDDYIGDLDTGVVDVVLHVHFAPSRTQQTDKSVTQNGVAQVPDMCCFVRVYGGMFNDYFTLPTLRQTRAEGWATRFV